MIWDGISFLKCIRWCFVSDGFKYRLNKTQTLLYIVKHGAHLSACHSKSVWSKSILMKILVTTASGDCIENWKLWQGVKKGGRRWRARAVLMAFDRRWKMVASWIFFTLDWISWNHGLDTLLVGICDSCLCVSLPGCFWRTYPSSFLIAHCCLQWLHWLTLS